MSEFDRQDLELIQMVGENHRRSNTTTFFGYVIREDQARRFAAYEAAKKRETGVSGLLLPVLGLLATIVITILAFV